jgi:hypothetical protein
MSVDSAVEIGRREAHWFEPLERRARDGADLPETDPPGM